MPPSALIHIKALQRARAGAHETSPAGILAKLKVAMFENCEIHDSTVKAFWR
jgi:hypothetical protein